MAVQGGLADGVLLGMNAQALLQVAAALRGMGAARTSAGEAVDDAVGGSVVAGGEYVAVAHDHRRDVAARAVRTRSHDPGDVHEVLVPAGPLGIDPSIVLLSQDLCWSP